MASKIIVKLPVSHFGQVTKSKSNRVSGGELSSRSSELSPTADEQISANNGRVAQLEQNIRFLQEQHQLILTGLHKEIEGLLNQNRDLQFQLIFIKGSLPSSPSSPEDDIKHKVYTSPKEVNVTSLQVEILEKELGELKLQLTEAENRNLYLSAIVDEQKKKLDRYERDREKEHERSLQPDPELLRKLDDAETIIKRLRRENSDLRHENGGLSHCQLRDPSMTFRDSQKSGTSQGRGNSRHRNSGSGHYKSNWFPSLHSQNFWQQGSKHERNGAEGTVLPNLQDNDSNSKQYQGRRGSNNNHYHNNDTRKYRSTQTKSTKPS